jgi:hypothetical protein
MSLEMARELARDLAEQLLQPRRVYLKQRGAESRYVRQLRRDIAAGKARPFDMVLAVSLADLDDGAPIAAVIAPYLSAAEILRELGQELASHRPATSKASDNDGALLALIQRENRLQADCDEAERDVIAEPTSREILDRALASRALYDAANDRVIAALRARRARLVTAAVKAGGTR